MSAPVHRSSAATHPGAVRTHNEDCLVERPDIGLWAVADGAGGHEAGEVASRMVADALSGIPDGLSAAEMLGEVRTRIEHVHTALRGEAERRGPNAMIATTIVVLLIRDGHYACLWAGDSRAYLLRDGVLLQISRDHSLVQELVDAGALSDDEALTHPHANVITRAVGAPIEALVLEKAVGPVQADDRFLLCSDGIDKCLSDQTLADLLAGAGADGAAAAVVGSALEQGATDNVTAVSVTVVG